MKFQWLKLSTCWKSIIPQRCPKILLKGKTSSKRSNSAETATILLLLTLRIRNYTKLPQTEMHAHRLFQIINLQPETYSSRSIKNQITQLRNNCKLDFKAQVTEMKNSNLLCLRLHRHLQIRYLNLIFRINKRERNPLIQ